MHEPQLESYREFRGVVCEAEEDARNPTDRGIWVYSGKSRVASSVRSFVFFEDVMDRVQAGDRDAATDWVLTGEKEAWLDARRKVPYHSGPLVMLYNRSFLP